MNAQHVGLDSHALQVTDYDLERRKKFVDLQQEDLDRIAAVREPIARQVDKHVAVFFGYLEDIEEASGLFRRRDLLEEAKRLKQAHLLAMVGGDYGKDYIEQRVELGTLYGRAGLDSRVFLGAFHGLMHSIGSQIAKHFARDAESAYEHFMSLQKIAFFDLGIIVDVLIGERERIISQQQAALLELSTPALLLRDRLLILPIIGVLDSSRARQLTDGLLHAIRAKRAKVVVMDVTGVATVDSKVANHLIQTIAASRLMGAAVIVTGLSANVAQSLVTLGVDLSKLNAIGDLQGGLEEAERLLGYEMVRLPKTAPPRALA
jgi:rsbT co-antagonist protein RsbR